MIGAFDTNKTTGKDLEQDDYLNFSRGIKQELFISNDWTV